MNDKKALKTNLIFAGVLLAVALVLFAVLRLRPAGGVYLEVDARKGPNDYHVETRPSGAEAGLEYLE